MNAVEPTELDPAGPLARLIGKGRGFVPELFQVMGHNPVLTEAWVRLADAVREQTVLDARTRELVILLVAHLEGSDYEWRHHARVAHSLGVTEAELDAIVAWPERRAWSESEWATLTLAAGTVEPTSSPGDATDPTAVLGAREVVDIAVTAAYYVAVARFAAATGLDVTDAAESTSTGEQ